MASSEGPSGGNFKAGLPSRIRELVGNEGDSLAIEVLPPLRSAELVSVIS